MTSVYISKFWNLARENQSGGNQRMKKKKKKNKKKKKKNIRKTQRVFELSCHGQQGLFVSWGISSLPI